MQNKIILALDVGNLLEAEKIVDRFSEYINIYKVGPFLFYRFGWKIIDRLKKQGKKVFLDLKIHDIPNVVKEGVKIAEEKGIDFFTLHLSAGREAMQEAVREKGKMKLLGVTVLTSLSQEDLQELGWKYGEKELILNLTRIAKEAGIDGVVAGGREVQMIKKETGENFLVVTPGIRWSTSSSDDQKRVSTPRQAFSQGADYIVMGRSLIHDAKATERLKKLENLF
ncbi:MAG: orotidine-5'-phosphate decarboxylase [Caldiserica bacterium]|nr:orotidine-5'-phosphate decarboxylase [Caldisericota bacterium]